MKRSFLASRIVAVFATILQGALVAGQLHGAVIAVENFDYKTPTIRGCAGGEGWADAWNGDNVISVGSLEFASYRTNGNRLTTLGDSLSRSDSVKCSLRTIQTVGREDVTDEEKFGRPGTTIWLSFLANMPEGPNAKTGMFAGVSLLDDRREQIFFGRGSKRNLWCFECPGQSQNFSTNRADESVVFLVYRMTFLESGTQVDMWVNPKPGTKQPITTPVAAAQARSFMFNRVRICSAPGTFSIDELRLGTTYADVAPVTK
jgi:hypothetical protein